MKEILTSAITNLVDKISSPFYGIFLTSAILWNWKFFYIMLWQNEEKLPIPKIEYVQNEILKNQSILEHFLYFLILPTLSTLFIIWILPYLTNAAYKKHEDFHYKRKQIQDKAELDYEKIKKDNLAELSKIKTEQATAVKEIEDTTTDKDKWRAEFTDQIKNNQQLKQHLTEIKNIIYVNYGWLEKYGNNSFIKSEVVPWAHTAELISLDEQRIELTDKGKFFISLLLQEENTTT